MKRIKTFKYLPLFLCIFIVLTGCQDSSDAGTERKATSVILLIGDGMGEEHRRAARFMTVGESGLLAMDDMPCSGYARTSSYDSVITDSSAAATAIACGVKTYNDVLGLDADLNTVPTILEEARLLWKMTGLVTTVQITHTTPAAFVAHVENENLTGIIVEQMMEADVNILLGGGENIFLPSYETGCYPGAGQRSDNRNLIEEAISHGYAYVCDPVSFSEIDPRGTCRLLGLFSDQAMIRPFSPSLAEMTQKAIDVLSNSPCGFFLMVEGGQIDWASHANDAETAITDTIGFDEAVSVAKAYASENDNTLVIVTADHETGGMMVSLSSSGLPDEDGPFEMPDGGQFYVNWTTTGHTAFDVPVTSSGPESESLTGVYENTHIFDVMLEVFKDGFETTSGIVSYN